MKLSPEVISARYKGEIPESAELEGLILSHTCEEESVAKPNAFFSGRVFLLVDNSTFSSAAGFAAMFRDYSVGTIIGYETGGVPVSFGDLFTFELNNTGIRCGVSHKQFFCPKPRPGDDERGVLPDILMTHELLRQYQNEHDPVLAYTLDHIKLTHQK